MADMESLWGKLQHQSLLKKHLTAKLYEELKGKKTDFGGTLADCMRSGAKHPNSGVGIYASDPHAYKVFAPVLDEVIKDYHGVKTVSHPKSNFGTLALGEMDKDKTGPVDPVNDMVISTRVRVGRTHEGFGFPPVLNKEKRLEMEAMTKKALSKLPEKLAGTYYPLLGMSKEKEKEMVADHFLFKDDDPMLRDASGYDDWPHGRGIFFSKDKKFLVWINEEDHLRFISMQKGGNLGEVYTRLVDAITSLEKQLKFAHDDRLGYLTFCPTNLGTTLRASVHIRIPKLSAAAHFNDFCAANNLQARGIHGEHTASVGGVYDISNKRRLGLSEIEAITEMKNGVMKIIEEEKRLQACKK
eukprot:TRINITY_DN39851_c0_g2_i1.p1 TRINITY_DN39851_c0_g2~~TRINITY_DN39851_c0_g2_i1.p1  ORF type:complete len:356 (+),score=108.65 TRINITY_DN39851_c0_g2_i1:122-1189(+)